MNKKLVLFDIDGTLVDHDKKMPESAKQAISELKNSGHIIAIATGRAPFMFEHIREELDINTYVGINGQYVVHDGDVVYKNPLNQEAIKRLIFLSEFNQHPLGFIDEKELRVNTNNHDHVRTSINSLKFDYPPVDSNYWVGRDIYQILLFNDENKEESYRNKFGEFDFIRWHQFSSDVLPIGGSKANGIKQLIEHLGVSLDDTYAFGDGLNDIEMLKYVPNSVAMGNAVEELKRVAKHITTNVDDDGILNGLKKLELI